jgi:hypothetical protein
MHKVTYRQTDKVVHLVKKEKMLLIYHFNGDREVIEEKNFKYSQKV